MVILGLDLSLTAPGIAYGDVAETLKPPNIRGIDRLAFWRDTLGHVLRTVAPDVVVLEGYSYGSQGRSVVQIGELGGLVRLLMADARVAYAEVAPAKVKKYATGKGNASKEAVAMAATHRAGRVFSDNNAADAWWLMQMGVAHYTPNDPLLVPMPVANRTALVGIAWPARGRTA